jgi:hypothetical protein
MIGGMTVVPPIQEVAGNSLEDYFTTGKWRTNEEMGVDFALGTASWGFSYFISGPMVKKMIPDNGGRPATKLKTIFTGKQALNEYSRSLIEFLPNEIFDYGRDKAKQCIVNNANKVWNWSVDQGSEAIDWTGQQVNNAWDYSVEQADHAADLTASGANKAWDYSAEQAGTAADWTANQASKAWDWSVNQSSNFRDWLIPVAY